MRAAALILAAGRGTRMGGACKAALRVATGLTFVEAIAGTARAAGCARIVVVAAEPWLAETRALAEAAGCEIVVNPDPDRGMTSSLVAGLATLDPADVDVALSWPVDHPYVLAETVNRILRRATRDGVVVPTHAGRGGHPPAFGAGFWSLLESAARHPEGARSALRASPDRVLRLPTDDAGVRRDIDTPADL